MNDAETILLTTVLVARVVDANFSSNFRPPARRKKRDDFLSVISLAILTFSSESSRLQQTFAVWSART